MSDLKKYILKAKIMIIIELGLIILTFVLFGVLENIIVGVYFILYVSSIILWVLLFILTVILYIRAKK
jgi:hypothetical protein